MKIGRKADLQRLACAVQPGFDGSNGNIKYLGNILIRNILKIPEQNDARVFWVEAVERLLNPLLNFFVLDILDGVQRPIRDHFGAVKGDIALLRAVQALTAGARVIESDAIEPRREIGLAAKLMDGLKCREKHFLRYLRRFIVISQQPVDQVEYRLLMSSDQDFKGIGVTSLYAPDAFGVTYPFGEHGPKLY